VGYDLSQLGHLTHEQSCHGLHFGYRDEKSGAGVGDNFPVAPHVFFDLGGTGRRVERHRYAAAVENTEKTKEIVGTGGQHDRHRLTGFQVEPAQPGGDLQGFMPQHPVTDADFILLLQESNMQRVGLDADMLLKDIQQGFRSPKPRLPARGCLVSLRILFHGGDFFRLRLLIDGAQEISWGLSRQQHPFRQFNPEFLLQPGEQFHPGKTVQAKITVEAAVEGDRPMSCGIGVQFRHEFGEYRQKGFGGYGVVHDTPREWRMKMTNKSYAFLLNYRANLYPNCSPGPNQKVTASPSGFRKGREAVAY